MKATGCSNRPTASIGMKRSLPGSRSMCRRAANNTLACKPQRLWVLFPNPHSDVPEKDRTFWLNMEVPVKLPRIWQGVLVSFLSLQFANEARAQVVSFAPGTQHVALPN